MKNFDLLLILITFFTSLFCFSQTEDIVFTSKDSVVENSWIVGLGYNFVDDSGDVFDNLFSLDSQWNSVSYPSRLSVGRYFKSGLGLETIATYNKYKSGKVIDMIINDEDKTYLALDTRVSYSLNKLLDRTSWFDPYVGLGIGYTDANNEPRGTYNAIIGFRTWFSDCIGLDLNSSGKWRMGNTGTNHIQHAAGIVYQFGIEKELSKKGKTKLASLKALELEQQRVNDSINTLIEIRGAAELEERVAKENEAAKLEMVENTKIDSQKKRKQQIESSIRDLGHVHFDLNSSYLNTEAKTILARLAQLLIMNPDVALEVASHTDSRGEENYNKWLSKRRVDRTINYIVELGADSGKLRAKAYGEEKLLNNCDNSTFCSEDKHKINRRSEFIVVEY